MTPDVSMGGAGRGGLDAAALTRLVLARASARQSVARAEDDCKHARLAAFRRELGVVVDLASPLATLMLDRVRLSLDEVSWMIRPAPSWPECPTVPPVMRSPPMRHALRARFATGSLLRPPADAHGADFMVGRDFRLSIRVVGNTLEAYGVDGRTRFASRRDTVVIALPMPADLDPFMDGVAGVTVGDVVGSDAFAGLHWPVVGIERRGERRLAIIARSGMTSYRVPWCPASGHGPSGEPDDGDADQNQGV